jgi:putative effector of murein hydrolase
MGISAEIGGIPSLSAAVVIATGVLGAIVGPRVIHLLGIRSRIALGLAIGAAAHGIGTARLIADGEATGARDSGANGLKDDEDHESDQLPGAVSSFTMALNGVVTAVLVAFIQAFHQLF